MADLATSNVNGDLTVTREMTVKGKANLSYEDEGVDPDYTGVKYRFVVKDGEFFLEVVSV